MTSCANVPIHQGTSLSSYEGMAPTGGSLTKAKVRIDRDATLSAKTVRIVPTSVDQSVEAKSFDAGDLTLLTNAVNRALCSGLSDRFQVVSPDQPADLVVHATVTNIIATNRAAAATSAVASLGGAAMMVPVPRIPVGLGGLAVEAEATAQDGSQKAAMLWSRGANMFTTKARVSKVGDAYSLSSAFGASFSRLLVDGKDPFKESVSIPTMQRMKASLGGTPKYEACKQFGSAPGIKGAVAGQLGLPPGWTDKGTGSKS